MNFRKSLRPAPARPKQPIKLAGLFQKSKSLPAGYENDFIGLVINRFEFTIFKSNVTIFNN